MWGTVLKRDLLGEVREEDKFYTEEKLREYLKSEVEKQGENVVIRNLDVSHIEDLSWLFVGIAAGVKTLDLSGWKTSNVKDMSHMFSDCEILESIDLSGWDTSNVNTMMYMFLGCKMLKSLDLSGWNISNVEYMNHMLANCYSLKSLNLSGWDDSNVENMKTMLHKCSIPSVEILR